MKKKKYQKYLEQYKKINGRFLKCIFNNIKEGIDWLENQPRFRPKTSLDYIKIAYNMLNINFNNIKKYMLQELMVKVLQVHF